MKSILRFIAAILFLFPAGLESAAQYDFNKRCQEAYNNIIGLRFADGRALIDEEKIANPDNKVTILLENYIDFLAIIISEEEDLFESRKGFREKRMEMLEPEDGQTPYYFFSLAQINLQWAFIRIKFGEYFRAAFEIQTSYHYLEKCTELNPDFMPGKLGMGMMHVLVGSIPDKYKWIAGLFSMEGSIEHGVKEIKAYIEYAHQDEKELFLPEALFFLGFVNINLLPDKHTAIPFEMDYKRYSKQSPLVSYAYGRLLMDRGRNDDAIAVFENSIRGEGYFDFYYLDYLTGLCYLHKLDKNSVKYFYSYVTNFGGKNYIKETYQKIAWSCLIEKDTNGFYTNMQKVIRYGFAETDGDKLALKEAESEMLPNTGLLQARLLFDGGYYEAAGHILESAAPELANDIDSTEWFYRYGRVYDDSGNPDKAEEYYLKAIDLGEDLRKYYAANAALKLGNIYELRGDNEKAAIMYQKCRKMDFDEYETSIRQKAKAGLNRIGK